MTAPSTTTSATSGIAKTFGRPGCSFYSGLPDRQLTTCPDCKEPADAMFGDHGGECIQAVAIAAPNSALGIIRAQALRRQTFSANDLREAFVRAGVSKGSHGGAMTAALKRGWIEDVGTVRSTSDGTKGHKLQTYKSLIFGTEQKWDRR